MEKFNALVLLVLFSFISTFSFAQGRNCPSVINPGAMQTYDPDRYQRYIEMENFIANYINNQGGSNNQRLINPNGIITIPVVVHVLHRNEPIGTGRNISVAQIQSQIDVLNEDFRRLNPDRFNTPAPFAAVSSDFGFEFKLACVDPDGNPTTGITRTYAGQENFTTHPLSDTKMDEVQTGIKFFSTGGRNAWPTQKYLNIWVASMTGGTIGYGTFPFDYIPSRQNVDGIVIRPTAFGRIGNLDPAFDKGRTATHEVGHWLDLFHIWGDNFCGDDRVNDTPEQYIFTDGCPSFPKFSTCPNNGSNGDMFMNYMDYTNDVCMNLFTNGQGLRGRAIFSSGGVRESFIDEYFKVLSPVITHCTGTASLFNPLCLTPAWSIASGPAYISSGQGTNNVTFTITGTGNVVLRATGDNYVTEQAIDVIHSIPTIGGTYFSNGQEHPLLIWYGDPNTNYNNVCNLQTINTNMQISNATTVTWSKVTSNPGNISWWQSGNNLSFYFWNVGQTAIYKIEASNSCGTSTYDFGFKSIQCTGGGGCEQFAVSPNPASGEIDIIVPNIPIPCDGASLSSTESSNTRTITEIRIYDSFGNLKKVQKENKNKKTKVNLYGLKSGLYIVEISDGIYKERHQILIQQ